MTTQNLIDKSQKDSTPEEFQEILEYVRELRGVDFNAYRGSTIKRRFDLRLSSTRMHDYASYQKFIKENPAEIDALIDSILINISHFFRNPFVFEALREIVLPELFDAFKDDILRIWCAGCARGEEAYSVAILANEIVKKETPGTKIFIIGTDIDRKALEDGKKAMYKADSVLEVKKDYLDKYFIVKDGFYHLKDEIRSLVTFAYHDITTRTTPREGIFSDYHLILCRNVVIYFNRELSAGVFNSFTKFIKQNGYLVLGEAENISQTNRDYEEILQRAKIFRKR